MLRNAAIAALASLGCAIACAAPASKGAYFGGSIGGTRADVDCAGASSCDRTSLAGKIYGGYKVTDNWALEGIYFRNGKVKEQAATPQGTVDGSAKVEGLGVGAAWHQAIDSDWEGVARLGVARHRTRARANAPLPIFADGAAFTMATTGWSNDPYLGVSLGYKVAPNVVVDAGWDFTVVSPKFRNGNAGALASTSYRANVNTLSVGMRFDF